MTICEDSSSSVEELWPDIDKLDNPSYEDTFVVRARDTATWEKVGCAH
jgi:hypothetical protein